MQGNSNQRPRKGTRDVARQNIDLNSIMQCEPKRHVRCGVTISKF